jgi:hypothetical protein
VALEGGDDGAQAFAIYPLSSTPMTISDEAPLTVRYLLHAQRTSGRS